MSKYRKGFRKKCFEPKARLHLCKHTILTGLLRDKVLLFQMKYGKMNRVANVTV